MSLFTDHLAGIVASGLAGRPVAVDTETDAGPLYGGVRLRLVSISDGTHTVVIDPERHAALLVALLQKPFRWVAHNAEFDKAVIRSCLGVELGAVEDTYVLGHLIDPRQPHEGGHGLGLDDLAAHYLGEAKLGGELKAEMKRGGWSWATIPVDNPVYLKYAARDAELTARMLPALEAYGPNRGLVEFEYRVAAACSRMEARGVLVDREYTLATIERLRLEAAQQAARAAALGVANVNSPRQVQAALGLPSASKEHLQPLAAQGNELAQAILAAKGAQKRAASYCGAFLKLAQGDGRLHAEIRPLLARTGRMSISRPPLQQLPAGDGLIRRCLVADPGQGMFSVDFKAVEIRVLAALCRDEGLIDVILSGADLHDRTAATIFGPGFTKQERKLAKVAAFCTLYGGGAQAIVTQTGASLEAAQEVRAGFLRAYPGIKRYASRLSEQARESGFVVTRTGRRLPVDKDRGYSALNYVIQSTARDLFAQALLDVEAAGYGNYLLLPIHDELVGQAPAEDAERAMRAVAKAMSTTLDGIPIETDAEILGASWGGDL